ncbi:MAG: chemotaxis protein CheD [Nanoarchaeota archaeon]
MAFKMTEHVADMGKFVISEQPDILICLALGSCVGVSLYDPQKKMGGLAHIMLPSTEENDISKISNPDKYANYAIPRMLEELKKKGCNQSTLIAKIAGGAHMFKGLENTVSDIGKKNSDSVKQVLSQLNIKISAEQIGGSIGRTVKVYLDSGDYEIKSKEGIIKI